MNESLINQTAIDYDMEVHEVRNIYNRYFNSGEFYTELEKFIELRANQ